MTLKLGLLLLKNCFQYLELVDRNKIKASLEEKMAISQI